ncbi:hypothetical protein IGI43_002497 [Enterococcus sp. AZ126]
MKKQTAHHLPMDNESQDQFELLAKSLAKGLLHYLY